MNKKSQSLRFASIIAALPTLALADLQSDILAKEREMWIAWGKKDVATFETYLDGDYRFVAENAAPIVGKEANSKALTGHSCELGGIQSLIDK